MVDRLLFRVLDELLTVVYWDLVVNLFQYSR